MTWYDIYRADLRERLKDHEYRREHEESIRRQLEDTHRDFGDVGRPVPVPFNGAPHGRWESLPDMSPQVVDDESEHDHRDAVHSPEVDSEIATMLRRTMPEPLKNIDSSTLEVLSGLGIL